MPLNLLFICSRNQWRSPTAEAVYRREPGYNVRSAGTSPKARRRVSEGDLAWADIVFVMESRHLQILRQRFGQLDGTRFINLEIPDDYRFMDEELVTLIRAGVDGALGSESIPE